MKTYTLPSNPVAKFPVGVPFYIFLPGVDAHANLRVGSQVEFKDADGDKAATVTLQGRSTGQLAQLAQYAGGQHYTSERVFLTGAAPYTTGTVTSPPSDYNVLAEELEKAFPVSDADEVAASHVGRLYTGLLVVIPSQALSGAPTGMTMASAAVA